jgi:glycosyltransferase involved in cell wall biosynthesis
LYKGQRIGVAVPAYNESRLIRKTLESIPSQVDRIYFVDDASVDNTLDIAKEVDDPRIVLIRHENNRGVGAAIVTGYKRSLEENNDITAVMAGDNQMDPDYLTALLDPIADGKADYSKGNRLSKAEFRRGMSKWRLFGNLTLSCLSRVSSGYWHIVDPQNGYTAISRRALLMLALDDIYRGYAFENDMLVRLNVQGAEVVNVQMPARYAEEKSKIGYISFIIRTSAYLLRAYAWRMWHKYFVRLRMRPPSQIERQYGDCEVGQQNPPSEKGAT